MSMPDLQNKLFAAMYGGADAPAWPAEEPTLLKLGREAFEQGDFASAVVQVRDYVKANPKVEAPRLVLGLCLFLTGQMVQAQVEFERVLKTLPGDRFATVMLGLTLLKREKFDKVLEALG